MNDRAYWGIRARPSRLQMYQGCSAIVPCRWPLPYGRRRASTSSTFGLVTISGCAPYAAVDVQRPSFPGCRLLSLEQSATPCHVCTVTAYFPQSSEDPSLQTQFSLTTLLCPRSDTRHYVLINRCFYLLMCCICRAGLSDWITWRKSSRASATTMRNGQVARMTCCATKTTRAVVLTSLRWLLYSLRENSTLLVSEYHRLQLHSCSCVHVVHACMVPVHYSERSLFWRSAIRVRG